MPRPRKPWNADSSAKMFPELHGLPVEPPKPLAGTVTQGSSTSDYDMRARVLSRWRSQHPEFFEVVIVSAAEAYVSSLRCDHLGTGAYLFWLASAREAADFGRLLRDRVEFTIALEFAVEKTQPALAPTDKP